MLLRKVPFPRLPHCLTSRVPWATEQVPLNILGDTHLNTWCFFPALIDIWKPKEGSFLPGWHRTSCRGSGWTGKGEGSCGHVGAAELLAIQHFLDVPGHIHPKVNPKHPLYLRRGHTLTPVGAEHRLSPVTAHPSRKWQLQESRPKHLATKHATQQRRSNIS